MTSNENWSERTENQPPPPTTTTGLGANSPSRISFGDFERCPSLRRLYRRKLGHLSRDHQSSKCLRGLSTQADER
ncbi:hypothetical protein TNIN_128121 [Trichonephila inaurata madagascariensis]|uniref:Uncharacterized protein n=1 Tax=Trichonephila inaurata madagascariensis TaxID=2747483 RepID=A0A8X6Y0X3_9ARAC|nr:hypothetical protein TNIN_378561 [Trichonephila inaurata madagascariensis]GFY62581.1 hypothetical protein TNIN_128121 [Trichonephila inaurata madagascariensis]